MLCRLWDYNHIH